jgi:hypothetical protein
MISRRGLRCSRPAGTLGRTLMDAGAGSGWQPLRDIVLAGLEASGLEPGSDPEARCAVLPASWRQSR